MDRAVADAIGGNEQVFKRKCEGAVICGDRDWRGGMLVGRTSERQNCAQRNRSDFRSRCPGTTESPSDDHRHGGERCVLSSDRSTLPPLLLGGGNCDGLG